MIRRPPGAPVEMYGSFPRTRTIGAIAERIRFPPTIEFSWPGRGSNHVITLASMIPVPDAMAPEPKAPPSVVVNETIRPSRSTTFTWVVQSVDGGTGVAATSGVARPGSIVFRATAAWSADASRS